jgi:hypothetical protein
VLSTAAGAVLALPLAPGTLYKVSGDVKLFDAHFRSTGPAPLVFLVLNDRQLVHVSGDGDMTSSAERATIDP